jgi:hypothetical protein
MLNPEDGTRGFCQIRSHSGAPWCECGVRGGLAMSCQLGPLGAAGMARFDPSLCWHTFNQPPTVPDSEGIPPSLLYHPCFLEKVRPQFLSLRQLAQGRVFSG